MPSSQPRAPSTATTRRTSRWRWPRPLGQKPPDVAKEIVAKLPTNDVLEQPTVAGPGFINLQLKPDFLGQSRPADRDATRKLGVEPAANPRNVRHRLFEPERRQAAARRPPPQHDHRRRADAHPALPRPHGHHRQPPRRLGHAVRHADLRLPATSSTRRPSKRDPVRELARLYIHVRNSDQEGADDEDEEDRPTTRSKKACQEETAKLHAGDPENVALWKQFMPHCMAEIHAIYQRLGILRSTSSTARASTTRCCRPSSRTCWRRGSRSRVKGAMVIPNAKGIIPRPRTSRRRKSRRRSSASATERSRTRRPTSRRFKYRVEHFHPDAMLYVVDFRQALHFKTLFAQARRWGYDRRRVDAHQLRLGAGRGQEAVRDAQGRRRRTRARCSTRQLNSALAKYEESYAERREAAATTCPNSTDEEKREIAEAVGIGAVKYADLSQNRTSDYVFSSTRCSRPTATRRRTCSMPTPAAAASSARARSMRHAFRTSPAGVVIGHPAERALALQLLRFPEAVENAAADYLPHLITAYLWDLAKASAASSRTARC